MANETTSINIYKLRQEGEAPHVVPPHIKTSQSYISPEEKGGWISPTSGYLIWYAYYE